MREPESGTFMALRGGLLRIERYLLAPCRPLPRRLTSCAKRGDTVPLMPDSYSIVIDGFGGRRKVAKIWFGGDGSYYLSSPYHGQTTALLARTSVNYARQEQSVD